MKKILLAVAFAASAHSVLGDSDTRQVLMVRGAGNSTCAQYLEATSNGAAPSADFDQWLDGYITARNQTSPEVLDYAGAVSQAGLSAGIANYCRGRLQAKYYEAADALLSDLAKSGRVKYLK